MINKNFFSIYSAGLLQGIALVAFPAASTILTNASQYDLTRTAYGALFIPQAILSIFFSACNPHLIKCFGVKCIFLFGLIANICAMSMLAVSPLIMDKHAAVYLLLLFSTGFLGLGFGLTVPTLNGTAALLHPSNVNSTLLVLNALLGTGTALAPLLISFFARNGMWWGLPLSCAVLLSALLVFSLYLNLPLKESAIVSTSVVKKITASFWLFAAFAFLYGIIETLNGNWVSIYMSDHLQASLKMQSLALTAFWGMVTFGRVFYAALGKIIKEQLVFQISPFISSLAFIFIALLSPGSEYSAIAAFGLTGFGCSTLLPLVIGFGSDQLKTLAMAIPGMIISFYLLGYGTAAFGVGPLQDLAHISLQVVYGWGAFVALILGIVSFFIVQKTTKQK